ncbi:Ca2+-binding EF-hand superfamily protein [Actinopolyspora biskrensis]|uniref:Ca2+-binding EF-hand superfamily protein n=1 Tax=Actinopolyspora biskrensis TaxID=1470178 RepID=A0A852Z4L5_9ACTN|nr:EF-hand domain-containing protein [Actinopolyspora biskrensis]NYH77297.1 Ca2+-binding EF-hand superfamily protein [Actinopolyspora biskrensis]
MLSKQYVTDIIFSGLDSDGDGRITESDVSGAARTMTQQVTENTVSNPAGALQGAVSGGAETPAKATKAAEAFTGFWSEIRSVAQVGDDGAISKDGFRRAMDKLAEENMDDVVRPSAESLWGIVELSGNDAITRKVIEDFVSDSGIDVDVDSYLAEVDQNGDGEVSKDEVVAAFSAWNERP